MTNSLTPSSQNSSSSTDKSDSSCACRDSLNWSEKVAYLTHEFLKAPQVTCPLEHIFEPGLYIREIRVPAGTLIIGRRHRLGHKCQLLEGRVVRVTPQGRREYAAPYSLFTQPGDQLVIQAVTDIVARTVHPNPEDSRDVTRLEAQIFEDPQAMIELGGRIAERAMIS